VSCTV